MDVARGLARWGINNNVAASILDGCSDGIDNHQGLILEGINLDHLECDVAAGHVVHENLWVAQSQVGNHVAARAWRGCRRQGQACCAGEGFHKGSNLAVFGPEIKSPLARAVGFVHRHKENLARGRQAFTESRIGEAFG